MAAVPMRKQSKRPVRNEMAGFRTRELKANIAILTGLLAGGLPGTSNLSPQVTSLMGKRLETFRRELAVRDQRDELIFQQTGEYPRNRRTGNRAQNRAQNRRPDAAHIVARLSTLQDRGVQVVTR